MVSIMCMECFPNLTTTLMSAGGKLRLLNIVQSQE